MTKPETLPDPSEKSVIILTDVNRPGPGFLL